MSMDSCAICLQGMRSSKFITGLPCAHLFHTSCIEKLFEHTSEDEAKCPLCRQSINLAQKHSSTQREKDSQACESLSQSLELDIHFHNILLRQSRKNKRKKKQH